MGYEATSSPHRIIGTGAYFINLQRKWALIFAGCLCIWGVLICGKIITACIIVQWPIITESVDSVCRDGTDMPYVAIQTEAWKTAKTTVARLCGYLTFILESKSLATIAEVDYQTGICQNCQLFIFFSFPDGLSHNPLPWKPPLMWQGWNEVSHSSLSKPKERVGYCCLRMPCVYDTILHLTSSYLWSSYIHPLYYWPH